MAKPKIIQDFLDHIAGGATKPFTTMPYVGTAPIIESGSNATGKYVKYADGTMIQYFNATFSTVIGASTVTATVNLPASFYDTNYVWTATQGSLHGSYVYACIIWGQTAGKAVNTFGVFGKALANFDTVTTVSANIVAIGRWKA